MNTQTHEHAMLDTISFRKKTPQYKVQVRFRTCKSWEGS